MPSNTCCKAPGFSTESWLRTRLNVSSRKPKTKTSIATGFEIGACGYCGGGDPGEQRRRLHGALEHFRLSGEELVVLGVHDQCRGDDPVGQALERVCRCTPDEVGVGGPAHGPHSVVESPPNLRLRAGFQRQESIRQGVVAGAKVQALTVLDILVHPEIVKNASGKPTMIRALFWPRRSWRRIPGTIVVEALDPIPPGLDRKIFSERLQSVLEAATARLGAESGIRDSGIRDQSSGIKDQ